MTDEIAEAIEAACSVGIDRRRASPETMQARIKEFLRGLPDGMTVQEVLDEL